MLALLLVVGRPAVSVAEDVDPSVDPITALPNPFEGWQTWKLDGDIKVWFKDLDGATKVRVSATLPVGGEEDPEGLEGLAHFVEHVMFTDDRGRTEEEIKAEVKDRGGARNGTTSMFRTDYWVELPVSEWRFAMRWIRDRVFRGPIPEHVVEGARKAVVLEQSMKPDDVLNLLWERVFDPEWRRLPGFWEREFGLEVDRDSVIGTWDSVHGITRDDLQSFHDRWYGPQNVTFAVIGDIDEQEVHAWAKELFAGLERRGQTATTRAPARDPQRFRSVFDFHDSGTSDYTVRYKLYDTTSEDDPMVLLLRNILEEHLTESLRIRRKASYHVDAQVIDKNGHAYVQVFGRFDPDELDYARDFIDQTFLRLREGTMPADRFSELKRRAIAPYVRGNQTPEDLHGWITSSLYARDQYEGFPNIVDGMRSISQTELAKWTREKLIETRRHDHLARVRPISRPVILATMLAWLICVFTVVRRWWTDPVDLTRLRYVRKVKYSTSFVLIVGGATACLTLLALHVLTYALSWVELTTDQVDNYLFQYVASLISVALHFLLLLIVPASLPWKLLLFEHEWRLKFLFYRSKGRPYEDILEAFECRLPKVLRGGHLLRVRLMHWGLLRTGIYLRFAPRRSLFLCTRNNRELIEQLERFAGRSLDRTAAPRSPSGST